jgi:hypothetical protein
VETNVLPTQLQVRSAPRSQANRQVEIVEINHRLGRNWSPQSDQDWQCAQSVIRADFKTVKVRPFSSRPVPVWPA